MNIAQNPVQRFTARTSRDALGLVRDALGDDAVIVSTGPAPGGVEVLAMAQSDYATSAGRGAPARPAPAAPAAPAKAASVENDVKTLQMSTLSFQDYVRNRMLRRRKAGAPAPVADDEPTLSTFGMHVDTRVDDDEPVPTAEPIVVARPIVEATEPAAPRRPSADVALDRGPSLDMLAELKSMRGLIEERFGSLAFMDKLQRRPAEARLAMKLLDCGFSPALVRKLSQGLPADVADDADWTARVLERNLRANDQPPLEEAGGVYALVGPTGVGKTTTTAKLAAAFAARHGVASLGLVTLDAYRVGAHEQLRAYGRILGVPVHTAHDRASLEDLLDLLSAKKLVLIDTAGMPQRDARTRELLEMLSHRDIRKLLVVNAAAQSETIEDVLFAYRASGAAGAILSKIDEAVKLGPALDAAIRHKLSIVGVANGQRVPEDWHRLSAQALVQRALRAGGSNAWRLDPGEVNLVFAMPHAAASSAQQRLGA